MAPKPWFRTRGDAPVHRRRLTITGKVQGVGFRPWFVRLARSLGVVGWVANAGDAVVAEIEAEPEVLDRLRHLASLTVPPGGCVEAWTEVPVAPQHGPDPFTVVGVDAIGEPTSGTDAGLLHLPADVATCEECLAELRDPHDRRHGHPFVSCARCGPRASIITSLPWDRAGTTMAAHTRCTVCTKEFSDPDNRRFRAETICCHDCGPRLWADRPDRTRSSDRVIEELVEVLRAGGVCAVKGVGGYHLVCDAARPEGVRRIRRIKARPHRPLALLVPDVDWVGRWCRPTPAALALLTGDARPIVVMSAPASPVCAEVTPLTGGPAAGRRLGVMLPGSGWHHLVLRAFGSALVCTSANRSGEPMIHRDEDARTLLDPPSGPGEVAEGVDLVVGYDREIAMALDDPVLLDDPEVPHDRVPSSAGWGPFLVRRGRGICPESLPTDPIGERAQAGEPWIVGCGAHLKATPALWHGSRALPGPPGGDLDRAPAVESYVRRLRHLVGLAGARPGVLAVDLHPDAAATAAACAVADAEGWEVELVPVQHHHAHLAAVLAEHRRHDPVLGIVLDGMGYGTDGTMWGGELLVADRVSATRVGHLTAVPLPGGDTAAREPWRMTASLVWAANRRGDRSLSPDVADRLAGRAPWDEVTALCESGMTPLTSGTGRLLDALAAPLTSVRTSTFEGHAVSLLEHLATTHSTTQSSPTRSSPSRSSPASSSPARSSPARSSPARHTGLVGMSPRARLQPVPCPHHGPGCLELDSVPWFAGLITAWADGVTPAQVAAAAHRSLVAGFVDAAATQARRHHLDTVVLSGGVMANALIRRGLVTELRRMNLRVLTPRAVPANDGGLGLGQAAVAAAWAREKAGMSLP